MVPKKSRFCPKVPNFAFVASFRAKSQIPNPVSERLIMLLGTIKPHASPVNCIKCTVSLSDCSPTKGTIFKFLNFVIFCYNQKLEFFLYNECFRKGPQLRTWSSWGPNCWNGPHLVLILHKSPHFTLKRQVANSCRVGGDWLGILEKAIQSMHALSWTVIKRNVFHSFILIDNQHPCHSYE